MILFKQQGEKKKKQKNSKETNVVCFVYSKNLLDFLLKIGLI